MGRELIHIGEQSDFELTFEGNDCAAAVYGHIHQQFLRYGTQGADYQIPAYYVILLDSALRRPCEPSGSAILEIDRRLVDVDL